MKNKIILIFLLMFSTLTLKAEITPNHIEFCKPLKGLSKYIMISRQQDVDPLELFEKTLKASEIYKDVYIAFIIAAYNEYPLFRKDEDKQAIIEEFSNMNYTYCLNELAKKDKE